ncbi:HU family DNA-binding protein [Clostridium perfringens]|uniref:HU family DNA-binding protein n=1 Tax=Clostridium perfringens TaxID=1502 RepID=UPI0024BC63AE|nr:HU family DNA-binding protein [Clostridium perfringens]CAJ1760428.1 hypothetical protein AUSP0115_00033 [uncultured phage]
MTKVELVKGLSEKTGLTRKEVEERLSFSDRVVELVKETGEKVKLGSYITIEKKHVEEKSGVCNGKEYTTPEHDEIVIKRTTSAKRV